MTAATVTSSVYLADLVAGGTIVGSAPGIGPDGVYLVLMECGDSHRFTAWETFDGTTWEPLLEAVSCQPVSLGRAAIVARQLLQHVADDGGAEEVEMLVSERSQERSDVVSVVHGGGDGC